MPRLTGLNAAIGHFLAQQAIVFDVVGGRQPKVRPQRRWQQKTAAPAGQAKRTARPKRQRHQRGLKALVVSQPQRQAVGAQPVVFQSSGAAPGPRHFTQHKTSDGFTDPRRRRVGRCRHITVVPPVVLHREMAVKGGRQNQPGQPFFKRRLFATHFMAQVDAKPTNANANANAADGRAQAELADWLNQAAQMKALHSSSSAMVTRR